MPRNIVMSPFSFVAFELCSQLMEDGQEVIGIEPSLPYLDKGVREEKELYIGRNANLLLYSIEEFSFSKEEDSILYVYQEDISLPDVEEFLELNKKKTGKIVYITGNHHRPLIDVMKWSESNVQIQLPDVYGPWREEGVFEQCLTGGSFPFEEYEKADRGDLLYIDDAVMSILEIAESKSGNYQLRSGVENHWYEVLKELGYHIIYDREREMPGRVFPSNKEEEQVYVVNAPIKPEKGVEMLRRHVNQVRKRSLFRQG